MPELQPVGKYKLDEFREKLLQATTSDKWLPILTPQFDFRDTDPRKTAVLSKVSTILGRLEVAVQGAYEILQRDGAPLLKSDKGRQRMQYVSETDNPAFYYLVYLHGNKRGFFNRNVNCQTAKFILIPETDRVTAQAGFVVDRFSHELPICDYLPIVNVQNKDVFLYNALRCTTLAFNRKGEITDMGFYWTHDGLKLSAYTFDMKSGDVQARYFLHDGRRYYNSPREELMWREGRSWELQSVFFLNQDGNFTSNQGKKSECTLEEAIVAIVADLPLSHYIDYKLQNPTILPRGLG